MFCSSCGKQTADGSAFCGSCGRPIVGYSIGSSTGTATPAYAGAAAGGGSVALGGVAQSASATAYAGFWLRLVAIIIDNIVLGIPFVFVFFLFFASMIPTLMRTANTNPQDPQVAMQFVAAFLPRIFVLVVIGAVASWLYWALMESSSWQATLGKKALGLYVTDMEGKRITFGRASGRFWSGKGLAMVPYVGILYRIVDCVLAGFTERKQALHDMIAGTLVLRNN
jgi:uncharacterized RDD family membrane protein YckC